MSREIKFRTFLRLNSYGEKNGDYEGLVYNVAVYSDKSIGFSVEEAIKTFGKKIIDKAIECDGLRTDEEGDWIWLFDNCYDVEQFTGIKDINGKEVYENDIIKIFTDNGKVKYGVIEWNDDYHGWSVAYYNAENDKYVSALKSSTDIEVVGNIHDKKMFEEIKKWNQ